MMGQGIRLRGIRLLFLAVCFSAASLSACEPWIPRCLKRNPQVQPWHESSCQKVSRTDTSAASAFELKRWSFSGSWYAFPEKLVVDHQIANWRETRELWDASLTSDEDESDESELPIFDDDPDPRLEMKENGEPVEHMPALGLFDSLVGSIQGSFGRANWGDVGWIYDTGIEDGSGSHLCLSWSEQCSTSTSFEWQYEAFYDYVEAMHPDTEPEPKCGRIRVRAHEYFSRTDDGGIAIFSTAEGTCTESGAAVSFRSEGILHHAPE
jgi:hypothetical protein